MTLPAGYPVTALEIANELSLSFPLSLNHPWVIALAGKSGLPVSFSDLLGKSGHFGGNVTGNGSGTLLSVTFGNAPFFGGALSSLTQQFNSLTLSFSSAPNWNGNILVSAPAGSAVLTKANSTTWTGTTASGILPANGQVVYMTLYPN
jgi:hypothetical protein